MPSYFSKKDERQYEKVKASLKGDPRAEEIAARVTNQQRRAEGRAKVPPLRAYRKRQR